MKLSDERIRELARKASIDAAGCSVTIHQMTANKVINQALDEQIETIADWLEETASDSRLSGMSYTYGVNGLAKQLRKDKL